jgi:periplasmic divalent cation tolerance protein
MTDKRLVLTTCGSPEEARRIAQELVELRLAACVNIVPQIESVYRWQGEVETATEWLLVIKTTAGAFERLRDAIGKLHSYDVPECIEITIEDGSAAYLEWIAGSVSQAASKS